MAKLFIPGPVNVEEKMLKEMTRPMIGHRTQEFRDLHKAIVADFRELLNTQDDIYLLTCSSTGAMEAAIRNAVNKRVLCLSNGAFGRRWFEIAEQNGKEAWLLDFGEGIPFDYAAVGKELEKGYEAITAVLNESATGIENNLEPLKALLAGYPDTLLLADVVTGVFGTSIDFKGMDIAVFGTQKALALPPGMAVMLVGEKAKHKAGTITNRGYYFDLISIGKNARENHTLTTPNIPLMFALRKRLGEIRKVSMEKYIEKHAINTTTTREFLKSRGFELLIDEKNRSNTLTVVKNRKNIDTKELIDYLKARGYVIAEGYGPLKPLTFRIGHMGVSHEDTALLLKEIDNFLAEKHITDKLVNQEINQLLVG